ncbi:MAG: diguanylate cyclase [Cellulosilyticaceae bacterium]
MKLNKNSFIADLGMMLFLMLTFISILVIVEDESYLIYNIIMLNITFLIVITTYFTSLTTGLVINVVIIFIYFTVIIYGTIIKGSTISSVNYFWILLLPAYTILTGIININIKKLQDENRFLNKQNQEMNYIDKTTGFKNLKAFENDAQMFMSISKRYNIPLSVLIIKIKYYSEIERIIEKDKIPEILSVISNTIQKTLRTEDNIFLIDNQNITWGVLLLTDEKGMYIVKNRIRYAMKNINSREIMHPYNVNIELKMGDYLYNTDKEGNVFELIEHAKKELEYDVN